MNLQEIKNILLNDDYVCVIYKKDGIIIKSAEKGIKPLIDIMLQDEHCLEGAIVADKVIGKAAACILIKGKIKEIYGHLMSETAIELFVENNIPYSYSKKVPYILNRDKTDSCPMEKKVKDAVTFNEGYDILNSFFKSMK